MENKRLDKNSRPKTINNREKKLNPNDFIVSKTDKRGFITYFNEIFLDMSGYDRHELYYANHNLIRHPDMPQIAFKVAWELVQNRKEFFGFVKNLAKDGSFYWVFAYITADYNNSGEITGYTSFRRKPNDNAIKTIEPIYQLLLEKERSEGVSASGAFLNDFLNDKGLTYDELVINLQQNKG